MRTVEMNWLRASKIWWYWAWRALLASVLVGMVAGFVLGMFLFPFLSSESTAALIGNVVGAGIGVFFGVWVLKTLPEKQFSDFRVVLVAPESEPENEDA